MNPRDCWYWLNANTGLCSEHLCQLKPIQPSRGFRAITFRKPIFVDESKVSGRDGKPAQKQNLTHSTRIYQNHTNSYVQSGSAKHYQPQPCIAENGVEVREPSSAGRSGVLVDYESFKGNHRPSGEQNTGMRQTRGTHQPERPYKSSDATDSKRISQMTVVTTGAFYVTRWNRT